MSDYSNEIDLGRKVSDMDMPLGDTPTKGKSRKIYPTLYIDAVPGLEDLPREGCVMIRFQRTRMNIETPEDGDDKTGVTLEIQKICLPDDMDGGEKDLAAVMDGKMDAGDDEESEDQPDDESDDEE